ncbi:hypothetical protein C366_02336 [Cryptococcus neoformans Tu401-1]|nr:hypothetical protein C366_02336 [Cryptococcus neoformans var. grubii Tu401-1]OXM79996.1 hypothetical protein C364_02297 [Cryptococcus neoformans var. grubii Bt63]
MTMPPLVNPSPPRRSLRTRPSAFASTSTSTDTIVVNGEVLMNTNTSGSSSRARPSISSVSASVNTFAQWPSKRSSNEVKEQEGEEELGTSGTEEDEADEGRLSGGEDEEGQQGEEGQVFSRLGQFHGLSPMTKPLTKYEEESDSSVLDGRLKKKRRVTERRTLQNKTAQKKYRDKKKFLALRTLDFAVSMTRICSRGLEGKERKVFKQILKDYLADVSELDQNYLADFLTKTGLHSKSGRAE